MTQSACVAGGQNVSPWRGDSRAWGTVYQIQQSLRSWRQTLTPQMYFIKIYSIRAQQSFQFIFK